MPTSKSNLVVADCWHVFLLARVNVAGLMGMLQLFVAECFGAGWDYLFIFVAYPFFPPDLCRYILEGKELEFYMKKLQKKKGKGAAA